MQKTVVFVALLSLFAPHAYAAVGDTYDCQDFDNTVYDGAEKQNVDFFKFLISWEESKVIVTYEVLANPTVLPFLHQDERSFVTTELNYDGRTGHIASSFYESADGSAVYVRTYVQDGFSAAFMARCQKQ